MASDFETFSSFMTTRANEKDVLPFLKQHRCFFPNPEYVNTNPFYGKQAKICAFYLESDCVKPFVKCLLKIYDGKGQFPLLDFDDDDDFQYDNDLETKLADLLFINYKPEYGVFEKSYRGFIADDENNNAIVFYDLTHMFFNGASLKLDYKFVSLFELCNKDAVADFVIDVDLDDCMHVVTPKSDSFVIIEPPITGYICLLSDNKFVSLTEEELSKLCIATDALMNYKNKGHYFFFSDTILNPLPDQSYVRFAVFPLKIGKKYSDLYNSVSINKHIIGVKSPDQFIMM